MTGPRIVDAGDAAVLVQFDERIDLEINARAVALAERVSHAALPGVRDVVPTYRTVAVYFDPLRTDYVALRAFLETEAANLPSAPAAERAPVRIPVHYGGADGPDLADVAAFAQLSEADVIRMHVSTVYRVFMLGFVPGFAYMGTVPAAIAAPRRPSPRLRVPAGSVGIAGPQTAVYPSETPGGWQLIGRTSIALFELGRDEPFLLKAGDRVQFYDAGAAA